MKCFKCESGSVIQDGDTWVCWQHIEPCRCPSNHSAGHEWDYEVRNGGIPITIGAMEFQGIEINPSESC